MIYSKSNLVPHAKSALYISMLYAFHASDWNAQNKPEWRERLVLRVSSHAMLESTYLV